MLPSSLSVRKPFVQTPHRTIALHNTTRMYICPMLKKISSGFCLDIRPMSFLRSSLTHAEITPSSCRSQCTHKRIPPSTLRVRKPFVQSPHLTIALHNTHTYVQFLPRHSPPHIPFRTFLVGALAWMLSYNTCESGPLHHKHVR